MKNDKLIDSNLPDIVFFSLKDDYLDKKIQMYIYFYLHMYGNQINQEWGFSVISNHLITE